jgi:hypothetical protein
LTGAVGLTPCDPAAGLNCSAAAGAAEDEDEVTALEDGSELELVGRSVADGCAAALSSFREHAVASSATMATTAPTVRLRFRTSTPLPGHCGPALPASFSLVGLALAFPLTQCSALPACQVAQLTVQSPESHACSRCGVPSTSTMSPGWENL